MCGINGIIKLNGGDVKEKEIAAMNKKIIHRGPDDQGIFIDKNVGLGHVRLAILDLSEKGHQPMIYRHNGRSAVLVYNGEVYNFKELRLNLEKKGYRFYSNTDSEVILASYLENGVDCLKDFNGMFSFVIYDIDKKILFGARDRFGQKPLKYFIDDKYFIFSSEIKAILENNIKREVDFGAVDDFFTLQYVPAPKTGFKNIYKLSHSHYFIFSLREKKLSIKRYFDLDFFVKRDYDRNRWVCEIEKEFEKAVRRRLVADVPVGAFLSGGIDSSAVVAFMSRFKKNVKTFSISFGEKKFDEGGYAKKVAGIFKTDHTEFKVKTEDLKKHISKLVYQYEEPFADSSQLPTFILSKLARKYVTVALSGDGGDENFGGYEKYNAHLAAIKYRRLFRLLGPANFILRNNKADILSRVLDKNIAIRHYNFTNYFSEFEKYDFYGDDFKKCLAGEGNIFEKILNGKNFSELDKVYYLDFNSYIPDDVNVKVDMASMANSLEVRSPMLDYEFANLTSQIPSSLKTDVWQGKIIFKKMLAKYLPGDILRRRKHGFSVPIKHWLRNDLRDCVYASLSDKNGLVAQILKKEKVDGLVKEHMAGKDNAKKIWLLMALNTWHKIFLSD